MGLDIGGSHTRGVLSPPADTRARRAPGPANVQNVPAEQARALASVLLSLEPRPPHRWSRAPAAWTPRTTPLGWPVSPFLRLPGPVRERDGRRTTPSSPPRRLVVTRPDRAIAGTGSVAWAWHDSGREARSGGWGTRSATRAAATGSAGRPCATCCGGPSPLPGMTGKRYRVVLEHAGLATHPTRSSRVPRPPGPAPTGRACATVCELAASGTPRPPAAGRGRRGSPRTSCSRWRAPWPSRCPSSWAVGLTGSAVGLHVAERLREQGLAVTLLDANWSWGRRRWPAAPRADRAGQTRGSALTHHDRDA
ncbi:hypothetical protein QJS66_15085 [Kocuria rhizophila]|nr:hypothetical protein QJS66_15085 [Kocuria rhizophila]